MVRADGKEGGVFVPNDVMFDSRLNPSEKLLFAMALNLNRPGSNGCFAHNRYFAERIGVSQRQIRRMLQRFKDLELVEAGWTAGRLIFTMRENLRPQFPSKKTNSYTISED